MHVFHISSIENITYFVEENTASLKPTTPESNMTTDCYDDSSCQNSNSDVELNRTNQTVGEQIDPTKGMSNGMSISNYICLCPLLLAFLLGYCFFDFI